MATFILVHGTFTKSAHWPNLQDRLAETARAAGDEPAVEPLPWSGRNRASAREAAASAIFTLVQKIRRISANERIFIIGHSHGGSAIAYFLKEHPEAAKTLAGCAFLSTPFVAIRPRREPIRLICALIFFPFIAFLSVSKELWNKYSQPFRDIPVEEAVPTEYLLVGLSYIVVLMTVCFLFGLIFEAAKDPHRVEQSIRQQTADIPAGHYIFLRCSGDEAAAALSAAQCIAWLAMKASKILEVVTRPYVDILYAETIAKGSRTAAVQAVVLGVFHYALMASLAYGFVVVLPNFWHFGIFGYFSHMTTNLFTFSSFVVACVLLVCLLAVFLIFLTQACTAWAFGWMPFATGFLVEIAIEPLPFGEHSLKHIDWTAGSTELDGMVHSWTYAHPDAIRHLQNWVGSRLNSSY